MEAKELVALIGIVVSLVIGFSGLIITFRNSKKTHFINSVTSLRAKWIETVRVTISEFCGLSYQLHYTSSERMAKMDRIQQLRFQIKLQLNPKDAFDSKIILKVDEIVNSLYDERAIQDTIILIDGLIELSQDLLKLEWEGVKEESKNGNLSRKTKRRLYNKYLRNKISGTN